MYAGRIVETAPNNEFFNNPRHPYSKALLKSLPSNKKTKLETIQGQPPTLSQEITGCKFNPRCAFCIDICKNKTPELENITPEHKFACFVK
jgi:oligopeptide/dipeptide ABC transporter ATP-binding protein